MGMLSTTAVIKKLCEAYRRMENARRTPDEAVAQAHFQGYVDGLLAVLSQPEVEEMIHRASMMA